MTRQFAAWYAPPRFVTYFVSGYRFAALVAPLCLAAGLFAPPAAMAAALENIAPNVYVYPGQDGDANAGVVIWMIKRPIEAAKKEVQLSKYERWLEYKEWLPANVGKVYQELVAESEGAHSFETMPAAQ